MLTRPDPDTHRILLREQSEKNIITPTYFSFNISFFILQVYRIEHDPLIQNRACINTPKPSVYFYSLALGGDDTELFLSDV